MTETPTSRIETSRVAAPRHSKADAPPVPRVGRMPPIFVGLVRRGVTAEPVLCDDDATAAVQARRQGPEDQGTAPMTLLPIRRRTLLAAGGLVFAAPAWAAKPPCPPPQVLFVCPAGTVKSAIARETLRRRAAVRGVAVRVASRGLHPEDHVSPGLAARLKADGIDPAADPVRPLAPADLVSPGIVIAFDEAAQAPGLEHARVWDIPSWNSDYDHARSALAAKVEALVDELNTRPYGA